MDQIKKFGTKPVDGALIERWERVTKTKVHHYIRRGLVFSHQDVDKILDCVEQGIPVYLYTGRGPSSSVLHLGHMISFRLTKYLQDALNCIVIIQLSDDEKYLFKDGCGPKDLDRYRQYSYSNARDIIACGFDANKTFLFSNLEYNSKDLYFNNILLMKATNMSTIKATYGLGETLPRSILDILIREHDAEESKPESERDLIKIDELKGTLKKFSNDQASNLGQVVWPAFQTAPAFCTSFRNIFSRAIAKALAENHSMPSYVKERMKNVYTELTTLGSTQSMMCLVGMALDQSPFFRTARDNAATLLCPKPAVIHSEFLPGLKQTAKMSTTSGDSKNSTIFLDMNPKQVEKIIKQHSFSGGCDTMEEHKLYGGDIAIDIAYQYLTFFLDSDEVLRDIAERYTKGIMGTGELKKITAELVAKEIKIHQKNKESVTDEIIKHFFNPDRDFDIGGVYDKEPLDTTQDQYKDYTNYGIQYDRTFGLKCRKANQLH